nr:sulfatase-like hydrolase/transferase [Thermoanaerobaculia bacterium]
MRRRFLALLPLLALATGCQEDRPPLHPRHVFLITVDTLRADHLGAYGYSRPTSPYLDRLAAKSVLFERAIAQWPKTGVSFASLFTGQYPQSTGLTHKAAIRIPEGYLTLPEFFKGRGFSTLGVNSNGVLSVDLDWNRGFDQYLETRSFFPFDEGDQRGYRDSMNARRVNELALPLLEKHKNDDRLFVWIHYSDPHTPYFLPRDFANPFLNDAQYSGDRKVKLENPAQAEIDGNQELKFYIAQYDANIRLVDGAIEQLVGALEHMGLLEDGCIVFTADHGELIGEHGTIGHHMALWQGVLHVPLIVLDPAARAQALLLGLGFAPAELHAAVNTFSGGWRMRLQLARALMAPSDLLLLDEPTN